MWLSLWKKVLMGIYIKSSNIYRTICVCKRLLKICKHCLLVISYRFNDQDYARMIVAILIRREMLSHSDSTNLPKVECIVSCSSGMTIYSSTGQAFNIIFLSTIYILKH